MSPTLPFECFVLIVDSKIHEMENSFCILRFIESVIGFTIVVYDVIFVKMYGYANCDWHAMIKSFLVVGMVGILVTN